MDERQVNASHKMLCCHGLKFGYDRLRVRDPARSPVAMAERCKQLAKESPSRKQRAPFDARLNRFFIGTDRGFGAREKDIRARERRVQIERDEGLLDGLTVSTRT
jgi:hypothetical protein